MSTEEKKQPWGINVQEVNAQEAIIPLIRSSFEVFKERLMAITLQRMDFEQDAAKKIKAYDFVQQMNSIVNNINVFLELLAHKNPYQSPLYLRGVYFSSAAQEVKSTKNYFIHHLFKKIIISERDSALMNYRTKIMRYGLIYGGMSLYILALITIFFLWCFAYQYNRDLLNDTVQRAERLHQITITDNNINNIIEAQWSVYEQADNFINKSKKIPFIDRLGLFEGNIQLPIIRKILVESMQANFLLPVAHAYENQLNHEARLWPALSGGQQKQNYYSYYQTLRQYLMLALYNQQPNDQDVDKITAVWQTELQKNKISIETDALQPLVFFYLSAPESSVDNTLHTEWIPNKSIVETARSQLMRPADIHLLFHQLKTALHDRLPMMTASKLLSGSASDLFIDSYAIPGMYTKKGWNKKVAAQIHTIAVQASSGDWVLYQILLPNEHLDLKPVINSRAPDPVLAQQLEQQLTQYYFNAYLHAWYRWMNHLSLHHFSSLSDARDALKTLSSSNGAMVSLFNTIADNLDIHDQGHPLSLFTENNGAGKIQKAFKNESDFINNDTSLLLNKNLKAYLASIDDINPDLKNIEDSSNPSQAAQQYTINLLQGNNQGKLFAAHALITQLMDNETNSQAKKAMENLLSIPLRGAWQSLLTTAGDNIQTQWEATILPIYQSELQGRFPFEKDGDDMSLDLMRSVFDPQTGAYWRFVNQHLVPYVVQEGSHWKLNTWLGVGMNFSPAFLQNLQQASDITGALFSNGSNPTTFYYSLYPIDQKNIKNVGLLVNGTQRFAYESNAPSMWSHFMWTDAQTEQSSHLMIIKTEGDAEAEIQTTGIWSLFKLLDQASNITHQGTQYVVTWKLTANDGSEVNAVLGFKTDGPGDAINGLVKNPFNPPREVLAR
jgi:type VI secretion system protein ImpL